jgi:hypothetical protein
LQRLADFYGQVAATPVWGRAAVRMQDLERRWRRARLGTRTFTTGAYYWRRD